MIFICLNRLDGSSLADARANDLASVTRYRSLSPGLTRSNGRWISRSRRLQKHGENFGLAKGHSSTVPLARRISSGIMAARLSKHPENVPGAWYVDTSWALSRLCFEQA